MTVPPAMATSAGLSACRGSVSHRVATTAKVATARRSRVVNRDPCAAKCCVRAAAATAPIGYRRSCLLKNATRITSVARCEVAIATGAPRASHPTNEIFTPVVAVTRLAVTRWAPAPRREAKADSTITVGNSKDNATCRRRTGSDRPNVRKTGMVGAARPLVEGTAKVVSRRASVVRWARPRTDREPPMTYTAVRSLSPDADSPAAIAHEPISNQIVGPVRAPISPWIGIAPVTVSVATAASAISMSLSR